MLSVLSRDVLSEAGVNKMLRAARDSIQAATGETLNPAAETVLSLRQLLLAGKAAAWSASEGREDPSLEQARTLAREILDGAPAEIIDPREPLHISGETTLIERPAPTQIPTQRPEFSFDPDIVAVVERINAERDRDHIKEDTRKQLASQARLFIKATGITDVREITQGHLKFYKSVLQRLPTSYGKSVRDADRTIDELLARAEDLPEKKVGLSPRTINGHLDRFKLIFQFAKSESITISDTIELGLLPVREEKRNRDKREAFTLPELHQVFRHPIWTGCRSTSRRHERGNMVKSDGLYWGPILAGYSGARREEVLGLEPSDVVCVDGIPCYHIRDNMHRGVKTFSSERLVPIHEHLIELGFLTHVEEMRQRGASALFPELIATNESQSFGDKIYYNWAKALVLQLDGNPRELCFHSFRHYAIAHLKELPEVSEKQRRDLVGHSGGDVHDEQYDVATSMPVMSSVVAKLPRLF
ncbi:MAG: site-specific integrase [Salipiger thiooxidans]|uniref:site-specific integrase n=1 Tax=Salipiger thiooxidans TaxID=282683 RepID=UPI001CFB09E4|nr:site-specific integrase [Salipiger thiooxidans]